MKSKPQTRSIWFIVISAVIIILLVVLARAFWSPADDPTVPGQEVPVPVVVGQVYPVTSLVEKL